MQETQCDKFGVSGGLGEPRFGLKLWLGSADLIDDSSSKSWVLFRDLPYLAIVMGVDLCMFMSVGIARDRHTKSRRRDESLASAAAGASVPRILGRGRERGYAGKELEAPPKRAQLGTWSAPRARLPGGYSRSAAARVLLLPQSSRRGAGPPHF